MMTANDVWILAVTFLAIAIACGGAWSMWEGE